MKLFLGYLLILLAFGAGIIVLQIFLSKKESKWAGLILPIISCCISLMLSLAILLFSINTTTLTQDGEIIRQTVTQTSNMSAIIGAALYVFVLYNIPTAIFLAIYAACRGKRNKQRALEKMSVQDLE